MKRLLGRPAARPVSAEEMNAGATTVSSSGQSGDATSPVDCGPAIDPALAVSFLETVRAHDLEKATALLHENPSLVLARSSDTKTALHLAAWNGDIRMVQLLLANKADVNSKVDAGELGVGGFTALHLAAAKGDCQMVQLLLANKADVNSRADANSLGDGGDTALHEAIRFVARRGDASIVQVLLTNGADVNVTNSRNSTPLHRAAVDNCIVAAQTLLAGGANINANDMWGTAPLHIAARNGHKEFVELLLTNHAEIDAKSKKGETPMDEAISHGHEDIVQLLHQRGSKQAPLPSAAKDGDDTRSFDALVIELIVLTNEAFAWGLKNGFGGCYPQNARARQLGNLIYAKAGTQGMVEASRALRRMVVTRDGGGQCFLINSNWEGIGDWRS